MKEEQIIPKMQREGYSKHKDSLFRLVFQDKKDLLELYNAIRGTAYDNPDDLEVTTIENVFYMKMRNDLSFLIDEVMNLYEHQSTVNPNMPLRGVDYFARLYRKYVKKTGGDIYGKKRIPLPYPQFIIFYNGTEEQPERQVIRLSDSYILPDTISADDEPGLECRAVILNVNLGRNKELMEKSRKLLEYAQFVACVREKADGRKVTEEVIDDAIEDCIRQDILKEILEEHREEVSDMFSDRAWDRHVKLEEKRLKQEDKRLQKEDIRLQKEDIRLQKEDTRLQKEDTRLQKKDTRLQKKDERLQKKDTLLQKKEGSLQKKEGSLQEKEDSLQEKEDDLQAREESLQTKDERLKQLEKRLLEWEERLQAMSSMTIVPSAK